MKNLLLTLAFFAAPLAAVFAQDTTPDPKQIRAEGVSITLKNGQKVVTTHRGKEGSALYASRNGSIVLPAPEKNKLILETKGNAAAAVYAEYGKIKLGKGSSIKTSSAMSIFLASSTLEADNLKIQVPSFIQSTYGSFPSLVYMRKSNASLGNKTSITHVASKKEEGLSEPLAGFWIQDSSLRIGDDFSMQMSGIHGAMALGNSEVYIGKNAKFSLTSNDFGYYSFDIYNDSTLFVDTGGSFSSNHAALKIQGKNNRLTFKDAVLNARGLGIWDESSYGNEFNMIGGELRTDGPAIFILPSYIWNTKNEQKIFNFSGGAKVITSSLLRIFSNGEDEAFSVHLNAKDEGTVLNGILKSKNNSVHMSLTNGATWNLSGSNSYLESLHLDGATVNYVLTEGGNGIHVKNCLFGPEKNRLNVSLSDLLADEIAANEGSRSVRLTSLFISGESLDDNAKSRYFDFSFATYNDTYRWNVEFDEEYGFKTVVFKNFESLEPDAVNILVDPENGFGYEKGSATFSITARSPQKIKYQWQYSNDGGMKWKNTGGNSSLLVIKNLKLSQNGDLYRCVVSSAGKSRTSRAVELRVEQPQKVTVESQPESQECLTTGQAEFSVKADSFSGEAVAYKWEVMKPGTDKWVSAGSAKPTLVVKKPSVKLNGAKYRCLLSNHMHEKGKYTESAVAVLSVVEAVKIKAQPKAVTAFENGRITSSAAVAGGNLKYQWEISLDNGKSWQTVTGQTSSSLDVPLSDHYFAGAKIKVRCKIWNDGYESKAVTTAGAAVTVREAVRLNTLTAVQATYKETFDLHQNSERIFVYVYNDAPVTLTVAASGYALKYQWYNDGVLIKGATKASYKLSSFDEYYSDRISCVVSNAGSSQVVEVSVAALHPPLTASLEGCTAYFSEHGLGVEGCLVVSFFKGSACSVTIVEWDGTIVGYGKNASYSYKRSNYENGTFSLKFDRVLLDENLKPTGKVENFSYTGKLLNPALMLSVYMYGFEFEGKNNNTKNDVYGWMDIVAQGRQTPKDLKTGTNYISVSFDPVNGDKSLPFAGLALRTDKKGKVLDFVVDSETAGVPQLISYRYIKTGTLTLSFTATFKTNGRTVKITKGNFTAFHSPDFWDEFHANPPDDWATSEYSVVELEIDGVKYQVPAKLTYDLL